MVDVKVARVKEMYAAKQKRRKLYPGGGGGGMVTEDGRVEVLGCVDEASGRRHWGDTIVLRRQPRIRRVMGIPGMCVTQQVLEENQIVDRKVPRECPTCGHRWQDKYSKNECPKCLSPLGNPPFITVNYMHNFKSSLNMKWCGSAL